MKRTKNILCSLLACLLVILAVPTAVSAAANKPVCPKTQTLQYYRSYMGHGAVPMYISMVVQLRIHCTKAFS